MRILLLGKNGQVGWELQRTLAPLGDVIACGSRELDLSDFARLRRAVREISPAVIVNAAAYTAVDQAESEPEQAMAVNARAPGVLAEEAGRLGAALIHYSTDYVFDGEKGAPYDETDPPNPLGAYGRSKLLGEQAIASVGGSSLILRTSWVYSLRRDSFVTKVLAWARQKSTLRVVSDQLGSPTWCRLLAEACALVLAAARPDPTGWLAARAGIYHLAGSGCASRFEWAQAILKYDPRPHEQAAREIQPARSAEFPTPAARPAHSALDCARFTGTFGLALPPWEEGLRMALESS